MPYTSLKKLSVQAAATNSGTWGAGGTTGDDLNTGVMGPLDYMLAGTSTFALSSSNVSLTFTAGGGGDVQNVYWRCTGTLLANITISPTAGDATTYLNGFYLWSNTTSGSFSITVTTADGSVVLPQGRRGVLYVSTANNIAPVIVAITGSSTADPVPAGSKTIWYNTAAPSGWTAVALNDYAIKIVTSGSGGVTSGTVAYSTAFAITATDSTALTIAQMPLHGHPFRLTPNGSGGDANGGLVPDNSGSAATYPAFTGTPSNTNGEQIGGTGAGDGHTHDIDLRVLTAAFTLASRD